MLLINWRIYTSPMKRDCGCSLGRSFSMVRYRQILFGYIVLKTSLRSFDSFLMACTYKSSWGCRRTQCYTTGIYSIA